MSTSAILLVKSTTNTYANDTSYSHWYLGRLTDTSVASSLDNIHFLTRESSFSYSLSSPTATGLLTQEVIEPGVSTCNGGSSSCTLTTGYGYDSFGNRTSATVSGSGVTTRTSTTTYDSYGQFQTSGTNALGQPQSWTYNAAFGVPLTHTDLNGLITNYTYDSFGRETLETRPNGTKAQQSIAYCSGSCPTYSQFYVQGELFASDGVTQIGAITTTYYDMLSRAVDTDTQGFGGCYSRVTVDYDSFGQVLDKSRPYFTGLPSGLSCTTATPALTTFIYDDLSRVTKATFPDSSQTTYGYNGLTTSVTNNLSQTTTTTKNALALNASVTDANSKSMIYGYDALGDLLTVTDPLGNVITNTFDIRGNKVTSHDPDMGSWSYSYDVLGELTNQTDAKAQSTALTYDLLGRPTARNENSAFCSNWTYDNSASTPTSGQLTDAQAHSGSSCATLVSHRTYSYDSLARPNGSVLTTPTDTFSFSNTYNATNGQLDTATRPSGFVQKTLYNSYGYVCALTDTAGTPTCTSAGGAQVFEHVDNRDAELHLTQSTAANGIVTRQSFDPNTGLPTCIYTGSNCATPGIAPSLSYDFDTIGNLKWRNFNGPSTGSFSEYFCYDNLNRVTQYAVGSTCSGGNTVSYDDIGNITLKSDLSSGGLTGAYSYPASGGSSVRPHAVSAIAGVADTLTSPQYSYDGNGNLTCVSTGASCSGTIARQVALTAFNMAASITVGSDSLSLTYDDQHQRIQQVTTVAGTTTNTIYLNDAASGAISERVTTGTTTPVWTDYLTLDGKIVAQRGYTPSGPLWGSGIVWGATSPPAFRWTAASTAGVVMHYFVLDNLGSIAASTNASGGLDQVYSYDAWGMTRNPNGSAATCGTIVTGTITRGYTNQEQLPPSIACAVNLNARLYDPAIGKFMAADSVIPNAEDGQSYNRYAYVTNNPLSYTDITGHDADDSRCGIYCFKNVIYDPDAASKSLNSYITNFSNAISDALRTSLGFSYVGISQSNQIGSVANSAGIALQEAGAEFDGTNSAQGVAINTPGTSTIGNGVENVNVIGRVGGMTNLIGPMIESLKVPIDLKSFGLGQSYVEPYKPQTYSKDVASYRWTTMFSSTGLFKIRVKEGGGYHTDKEVEGKGIFLAVDEVTIKLHYLDKPKQGGPDYMWGTPQSLQPDYRNNSATMAAVPGNITGIQGQNRGGNYEIFVTPSITSDYVVVEISTTH